MIKNIKYVVFFYNTYHYIELNDFFRRIRYGITNHPMSNPVKKNLSTTK